MNVPVGLPLDAAPMEARTEEALPADPGKWQYEPKWDGFRCLAFKEGEAVELRGKSGKPLRRYFPEVLALLGSLPFERFVVDGELVIEIDGRLSFDALQMRLHPAESRVRKLAAETPARLVLFDMLRVAGRRQPDKGAARRAPARARGVRQNGGHGRAAHRDALHARPRRSGSVARRHKRDGRSGRQAPRPPLRKRRAGDGQGQADEDSRLRRRGLSLRSRGRRVVSLLLGLYDAEGRLDHVGFTSTSPRTSARC